MKNKIKSFVVIICFMFIFAACSNKIDNYYKVKNDLFEDTLYSEGEVSVPILTVSLNKPVFKNSKDTKFINDYFDDRFNNSKTYALEDFYYEALDSYEYYYNDNDIIDPYTYYLYYSVGYNTKDLVSVKVSFEKTYGGNHSDFGSSMITFDVKNQNILDFNEIFDEEKYDDLIYVIMQKLENQDMLVDDYTENAIRDCLTSEHVFFNEKGNVEFVFNTYDIASYALGGISIEFEREELSDILLDNFR